MRSLNLISLSILAYFAVMKPLNAENSIILKCEVKAEFLTEFNDGRAPKRSGPFPYTIVYEIIENHLAISNVVSDKYATALKHRVSASRLLFILTPLEKADTRTEFATTSIDRKSGELRGQGRTRMQDALIHNFSYGSCATTNPDTQF